MLNKCTFIGNLGQDPTIRSTQDGKEVASFSLGVTESWKDKNGQRQSKTEWVNVVVWGGLVNIIKNYTSKGSKVFVEGKLQTKKYTDKQGVDKYITEVVLQGFNSNLILLDGRKESGQMSQQDSQALDNVADELESVPF